VGLLPQGLSRSDTFLVMLGHTVHPGSVPEPQDVHSVTAHCLAGHAHCSPLLARDMMHSGSFTPSQRSIHNVVHAMVEAGIALVVEGSSFTAASARHLAGRRPRLQRR